MSSDDLFRGMVSVTVIEATGLKPVTRPGGSVLTVDNMNPYAVIDFDDFYFGKTVSRKGTSNPIWGEIIEESVEDAQRMQITLFSASSIPPDTFLAHVMIQTSELRRFTRQGFDEHEVYLTLFSSHTHSHTAQSTALDLCMSQCNCSRLCVCVCVIVKSKHAHNIYTYTSVEDVRQLVS